MATGSRHQSEPWVREGRRILSSGGKSVATAVYPADARRIVALVNSMAGIPTAALEKSATREALRTVASAKKSELEAVRRWLEAAGRKGGRPRGDRGLRQSSADWPPAARRIAAAVQAVAGVPTSVLESESIRQVLAVVAAAPRSDLRAIERWLKASRRRPARPR